MHRAASLAALPSPPISFNSIGSKPKTGRHVNELALFVNDCIEGHKTAAHETKDPQNLTYYQQPVQQSEQFVADFNCFARAAGSTPEASTTLKGKFYRGFMDAKTYVEALASPELIGTTRQAVERQHQASPQTLRKLQQLKGLESV